MLVSTLRGLATGAAALVVGMHGPPQIVYFLAVLSTIAATLFRSAHSAPTRVGVGRLTSILELPVTPALCWSTRSSRDPIAQHGRSPVVCALRVVQSSRRTWLPPVSQALTSSSVSTREPPHSTDGRERTSHAH
jgi:hypothetical protein